MTRPLYIAVEGPIGVGKSTLVTRLSERLNARLVMEVVEENPFLPLFYQDPSRYAFQTQIFFLMSRFRQQQELLQADLFAPGILADYHLLKDRIFAQLTLKDDELALYERIYASLETHIPEPDVIIYLHARLDVLLERIARRDRPFERGIDPDYLLRLGRAYQHYFAHHRGGPPVLHLDTSEIDYVARDEPIDALYAEIHTLARREPR